jgi:hypothetical protein
VNKIAQSTIDNPTVDTNPSISNIEKQIVCPSDKTTHIVSVQSLPYCYAIMQHLPGIKESKEFGAAFFNRMPNLPLEKQTDENIRNEFKSVFKHASDEYKRSRLWDDVVRQVFQII